MNSVITLYKRRMVNHTLAFTIFFVLFSTACFSAPPEAPILKATVDGLKVDLSWTKVNKATGYTLYYTPSPFLGANFIEKLDKGNVRSQNATLFLGASYYVAIKAYNANKEESDYSNIELVTIDQFNLLYVGMSRYKHNNSMLDIGTFQLVVDVDQKIKLSNVRLITPDNTVLSNVNIKDSNQIEIFIDGDLASMEPYLLRGAYRLKGNYYFDSNPTEQKKGEITFNVKDGRYPAFPKITSPARNAINVSLNPNITVYSEKPMTISITKLNNKKEVFFSNDIKYEIESNGSKTIKIESVTLEPKTKYLLEINQTDVSVAKGSTSAITFTTK
ncbi:MAG: hypothetical protein KAH20_00590 [Methylococcales bacterium]|nr:hypothetical protein [Methylococcales bacterium]